MEKDGLYQINDDKRILIKYSTESDHEWRFTFQKDDFEALYNTALEDDFEELVSHDHFIVLVCAGYAICSLSSADIDELMNADIDSAQSISISCSSDDKMKVRGSLGDLSHTVRHDEFPSGLLGVMTKEQEGFAWPPFSKLSLYGDLPELILSSNDRMLDLSDHLAEYVRYGAGTTVYFGLKTISYFWETWTDENLSNVEQLIEYDLEFDGYEVEIERVTDERGSLSQKQNAPCYHEFLWKLSIFACLDEEEIDDDEIDS